MVSITPKAEVCQTEEDATKVSGVLEIEIIVLEIPSRAFICIRKSWILSCSRIGEAIARRLTGFRDCCTRSWSFCTGIAWSVYVTYLLFQKQQWQKILTWWDHSLLNIWLYNSVRAKIREIKIKNCSLYFQIYAFFRTPEEDLRI